MARTFLALFGAILILQACGPSTGEVLDMRKRARNLATEDAQAELAKRSYEDVFGAAACARSCDAQNAGFRWAAKEEISDPADCQGHSKSFLAGCKAFAAEVQRRGEAAADRAYPIKAAWRPDPSAPE